jgi:hypothetical protein
MKCRAAIKPPLIVKAGRLTSSLDRLGLVLKMIAVRFINDAI